MKTLIATISLIAGACLCALRSDAQPATIPTNGLVAFYAFNGNANDGSGNGNDGIIASPIPTTDRLGITNAAYFFNGQTDYIEVTNSIAPVGSNEFTFTTWLLLSPDTFNIEHRFIAAADGQEQWQIFLGNNGPGIWSMEFYTGGVRVGGAVLNWPINKWFQLALVRSKGTGSTDNVSWYFNGQFITNAPVNAGNNALSGITFGRRLFGTPEGSWSGGMDDIRLYNRALAPSEVQQLYQLEAPISLSIGVAAWNISWFAPSNIHYELQWSTNLTTWSDLASVVGAGAVTNISDPNYGSNRFYRVIVIP